MTHLWLTRHVFIPFVVNWPAHPHTTALSMFTQQLSSSSTTSTATPLSA